jgi:hypothetical protein
LGLHMIRGAVSAPAEVGTGGPTLVQGIMVLLMTAFDPPGVYALALRCLHFLKTVIWCAPGIVFMAFSGSKCLGKGIRESNLVWRTGDLPCIPLCALRAGPGLGQPVSSPCLVHVAGLCQPSF